MTHKPNRSKAELAKFEALKKLPAKKRSERTEYSDIPGWAKMAMIRKVIYGETSKDALAAISSSKKPATLDNYTKTPAGRRWREELAEFKDNPIELAKAMLAGNALGITFDNIWSLDTARKAGDYKEVGVMTRWLMEASKVVEKNKGGDRSGNLTLTLNIGGQVEDVEVESEFEVIEADFDEDES